MAPPVSSDCRNLVCRQPRSTDLFHSLRCLQETWVLDLMVFHLANKPGTHIDDMTQGTVNALFKFLDSNLLKSTYYINLAAASRTLVWLMRDFSVFQKVYSLKTSPFLSTPYVEHMLQIWPAITTCTFEGVVNIYWARQDFLQISVTRSQTEKPIACSPRMKPMQYLEKPGVMSLPADYLTDFLMRTVLAQYWIRCMDVDFGTPQ